MRSFEEGNETRRAFCVAIPSRQRNRYAAADARPGLTRRAQHSRALFFPLPVFGIERETERDFRHAGNRNPLSPDYNVNCRRYARRDTTIS